MTKIINGNAEKQPAANCDPLSDIATQAVAMQTDIARLILNIRGVQVMIDRDLAMLYGVDTRVLNQETLIVIPKISSFV